MKKTLLTAAFSIMLATGAAVAQQAADDGEAGNSGVMGPFFTDETMTEVRPAEENQTTFQSLAAADQETIRSECATVQAQGGETTNETTASIDPDQLPPAIAALCEQVAAW